MEVNTCHNVSLAVGVQMKVVDGILVGIDNSVVPFVVVKMNWRLEREDDVGKETYAKTHPSYCTIGEIGSDEGIAKHFFVGLNTEFIQSLDEWTDTELAVVVFIILCHIIRVDVAKIMILLDLNNQYLMWKIPDNNGWLCFLLIIEKKDVFLHLEFWIYYSTMCL